MKKLILLTYLSLAFISLFSKDGTDTPLPFPYFENTGKVEFESTSIANGEVVDISPDELGMEKIVISATQKYYWESEIKEVSYHIVYGGIKEVYIKVGDLIKTGDKIGLASKKSYLTTYTNSLDPYMLRMTYNKLTQIGNNWYFTPDWIIRGHTAWLSFRQVDSFKNAVEDFYNRWAIEGEEPRGATIHHFNNLDRIRFKAKLNSYPVPANRSSALWITERAYYNGQSIFILESVYDEFKVEDYSVILYWQKNFDNYLREEYTLGEEVYIYGSIYSFDHEAKKIVVCIRDFSLISDEEAVKKRLNSNKNTTKE